MLILLFAYLLNMYLIVAREKFQILKNGSNYQGACPPHGLSIQIRRSWILFLNNFRISVVNIRGK